MGRDLKNSVASADEATVRLSHMVSEHGRRYAFL